MKGGYLEFSVFLACLMIIFNVYSSYITIKSFFEHVVVFLVLSGGLFGTVLKFRLPKPNSAAVHNIFGSNWGSYAKLSTNNFTDNNYVLKTIAHRACGLDAPENSLSALEKIHKADILVVEFDVLLTADNVAIVFHDTNLFRMTNLFKKVEEVTYDEIKKLDISVKHPFGKAGEKIPTLDEFVQVCIKKNMKMIIDLKTANNNLVEIINNLYKKYSVLYETAVVSSFNPIIIYKIRANDPNIVCSLAWRPYFFSHEEFGEPDGPVHPRTDNIFCLLYLRFMNVIYQWTLWKFAYYIVGTSALLLHKDIITREVIHYWNKKGVRVIAWTVNLPVEKLFFEKVLQITYLTDTVIKS